MKAVAYSSYGGPEQLRLTDLPLPEPNRGQLRLKILACGVNLSDWEYLVGSPFYARLVGGLLRPRQPVLGSDVVGVVDKLGPGTTDFALGDRVMGDVVMTRGGFAEFACVPADVMMKVPTSLSDEIAACLPQSGGIALSGTENLANGSRLLINGAGGGSGPLALQLAKRAGAFVTAVDHADKIGWLRALGADEVIDYHERDFAETGASWDRILDMVATRSPHRIARALAPGGIYRAVGGNVRVLLALVFGGWLYKPRGKSIGMLMVPSGRALTERVAMLAVEGRMVPHIEAKLPLALLPEALARTGHGEVRGKIVIRPP